MSKIARFTVLMVGLSSLFAVLSSTAGAVTWHNRGDTTFTATGGTGTLSSTGVTLGCPGADGSGTVPATPLVAGTLQIAGTVTFTGCTLSGQSIGLDCGYAFTVTTQPSVGVSSGAVDVTCGVYLAGLKICHISGASTATYTNPSGATAGTFVMGTNNNLAFSNGSVGTCPAGNGDKGHLTALTFRISDSVLPLGPVITRTV
jgi:hypothetical protein